MIECPIASLETCHSNHGKISKLRESSITSHVATDLEAGRSFALRSGELSDYIFTLTPGPLYEIEMQEKYLYKHS